jgi:Tol biopolymer transport system component
MSLLAFPSRGQTFVERLSDGEIWMIPAGGREVYFSPDNRSAAWTKGSGSGPINSALREVWVSGSDGSGANTAASVYGGGFAGWFPDGRLLIYGRLSPGGEETFYWALSLENGEMRTLAEGFRLRGAMVSPSGEWLAYQSVFSSETEKNGIWLVNTHTLEHRRLNIYGAYRWTAGDRLILAPLEEGAYYHRLLEADPTTGSVRQLTRPENLPFRIANGDWSISPDGSRVIFVSAEDFNIWMIEFEY